jgi:hypothetical protein
VSRVIKVDLEVTCLCGGKLAVGAHHELIHSKPTCEDYEAVETLADGAELLARIRKKSSQS